MEYWQGYMNWPLDQNWKCEICGKYGELTWGLAHAHCRCNRCHAQYRMRDEQGNVVTKPICQLKPEYYVAAKIGVKTFQKPLDEFSETDWQELLVKKE